MISTFHPKRGRGKKKRRKKHHQNKNEDKPESFDWDTASSGSEKTSNSTLIYFVVPDTAIWTPPGSGTGLIPLCLPRQERMVNQGLTQLNSLQRGVFASLKLSMALSFYDIQISSDYRLFSKILPLFLSKKTNLPVYSMIILSPSTIFLLLSPGPSFFPRPTFQNQTTNQFPYSFQQIKDNKSMETTTSKNLSMNYIVFTNKNTLPCCHLMRLYIYVVKLNENKNYLILKPHYDDQQRDHTKSASNGEKIHDKISLVSNYALLPTLPLPYTYGICLLYTSPSPRDLSTSRMPSSA